MEKAYKEQLRRMRKIYEAAHLGMLGPLRNCNNKLLKYSTDWAGGQVEFLARASSNAFGAWTLAITMRAWEMCTCALAVGAVC